MASKNVMVGTGAALAGLSGLAIAAVSANTNAPAEAAKPVAQTVETQTVVVRKVEHRVKRLEAKHHRRSSHAAEAATPTAAAPAAAPVVQPAPAPVVTTPAVTTNTAPIRTRTSGNSGRGGEDDGAEHEVENENETEHHGGDDGAEHADD
jgi:hypothetical protein